MENLENMLATGFRVSGNQTNTAAEHPRFSQYKFNYKGLVQQQKQRQEDALQRNKDKKFDAMLKLRKLSQVDDEDDVKKEDEEEDNVKIEEDEDEEKSDTVDDGKGKGLSGEGHRKKNLLRELKIKAMLSEWMLERPEAFEADWMMLMSPVGKRCIVVASRRGRTEVYNKRGNFMFSFRSKLTSKHNGINSMVLDCIFSEASGNFYVIDLLTCNLHHLFNSEVEFRWFWMRGKFREELVGCDMYSAGNPHPFLPVHTIECTSEALQQALATPLESYELDGLMFYHKRGHYVFKTTSLVLWLKPYMVQELLEIKVHASFLADTPSSYLGFKHHSDQITSRKGERAGAEVDGAKSGTSERENGDGVAMVL